MFILGSDILVPRLVGPVSSVRRDVDVRRSATSVPVRLCGGKDEPPNLEGWPDLLITKTSSEAPAPPRERRFRSGPRSTPDHDDQTRPRIETQIV